MNYYISSRLITFIITLTHLPFGIVLLILGIVFLFSNIIAGVIVIFFSLFFICLPLILSNVYLTNREVHIKKLLRTGITLQKSQLRAVQTFYFLTILEFNDNSTVYFIENVTGFLEYNFSTDRSKSEKIFELIKNHNTSDYTSK